MKKILLTLAGITLISSANAYTTENLNKVNYTCNGTKITYNSTKSTIQNNCSHYSVKYSRQVVGGNNATTNYSNQPSLPTDSANDVANLAKVKFTTDNGTKMECFYKESKLYKCKAKIVKPAKKVASS